MMIIITTTIYNVMKGQYLYTYRQIYLTIKQEIAALVCTSMKMPVSASC